jgi:3-phosphoshikimate 1-carboxyvinyltransferase
MKRIIDPLISMGVDISSVNGDGKPPLRIRGGGVKGINYTTKVASAQVKSCILLAGLYADGVTSVEEPLKSRDHTERMLKLFGADINTDGLKVTLNSGSKPLTAPKKNIFIPGDISSAAFFIALGLILEGSEIILRSVGINPTRRGIIDCLLRMGADIKIEGEKFAFEPFCDLRVRGGRLKATKVTAEEIPFLIDEIPVLTVCALWQMVRPRYKGWENSG